MDLNSFGIPQQDWMYYLMEPKAWDRDVRLSSGYPTTSKPLWVQSDQQRAQFKELRCKFRAVGVAINEIEEDDSNFVIYFKCADETAENKKRRLLKACGELENACLESEGFNKLILNNILTYCQFTAKNQDLENKLQALRLQTSQRGINLVSTYITIDQIKDQPPVFSRQSSVTLIDALENYRRHLTKAGIPKQLWGGVILNKIEEPAYSKIPPEVR